VSVSNIEQVSNYIRRQAEHHAQITFLDEYRAILMRHKIEFDERYLFDEEHVG